MTRGETWLAIAGAFAALAIIYLVVGRAVDAALAWWCNLPAGEPVDIGRLVDFPTPTSRPSLAESAGAAYFGAWSDAEVSGRGYARKTLTDVDFSTPHIELKLGTVSGLEPDDVTVVAGTIGGGLELDLTPSARLERRHLRLVDDEPDTKGAA